MKHSLLFFLFIYSFSTQVFSQCTHTITLYDLNSDGWNGGTVTVQVNGVDVLTGLGPTFATGSFTGPSFTFTASAGQTITVIRTADGSAPADMRVKVYGPDCQTNAILFSNPTVFPGISGIANCNTATDQTSSGTNYWIGYVYSAHNGNNPPANAFTTTFIASLTEPEIFNRNYGTSGPDGCNTTYYPNYFAIRYRMTKNFTAGIYNFTIGADDGMRLSVDGGATWLISDWQNHGYRTQTGSVYLSGNVNLVLEYYENTGDSRVSFSYASGVLPTAQLISGANIFTNYTGCSGTFYDSGGDASGSYGNNEVQQVTFYPSSPGFAVVLTFSSFATEALYDGMMFYNGNSTAAPLISSGTAAGTNATTAPAGSYHGTNSPGTVTSTAADGSLTVVFRSDVSGINTGWIATISCNVVCTPNTAPTSISGTNTICAGQSTTLTSVGGSGESEADDVWYEGSCGTECYTQEFTNAPASVTQTTVNSTSSGILNVTSTGGDPNISLTSVGSLSTTSCRYVNIRYRVISGTPGLAEIYFSKNGGADLSESMVVRGTYVNSSAWQILSIDMSTNPYWFGNITGWRFDWTTNDAVNMEFDFISLSSKPIVAVGTSATFSPLVTTTYYTAKKGPCNTTTCASKTVTVNPIAPTVQLTGTSPLCAGTTTTLSLNYPTGGTISTSGGYRYHAFTSSGSLVVPAGFTGAADVLVVAGGGGGGSGRGGGGGAGGLVFSPNYSLTPSSSITATIGAGGAAENNGSNSVFGSITAIGGGRGGSHNATPSVATNNGQAGGSGGGSAMNYNTNIFVGGASTLNQGNIGGTSGVAGTDNPRNTGGGGGAGQVGRAGANGNGTWSNGTTPKGGDGLQYTQFSTVGGSPAGWFAGGGGGSRAGSDRNGAGAGLGGQGGGGAGTTTATGTAGIANTGGGGGGSESTGGAGGSGVVLVRYYVGTGTWASSNTAVATVDATGIVTGVAAGTANITYTVAATGSCAGSVSTFTITVTANSFSAPSSSPVVCINTALTPVTMTTTGATGIGTATGLPAGVTASWSANTITISGTPTVSGTFNYSIPLTGGCGTVSATGTIIVNPNNTTSNISPSFCVGAPLAANNTMTTTGAIGIGTATGLPTGVSAAWAANTITLSGTPTTDVGSPFSYSIPLTGGCGSISATGTITILPSNSITGASSPSAICLGNAISQINFSVGLLTGISVTGLPAGVSLSSTQIAGTPTASGVFNYTIGSTEGCTATGTITVNAPNAITLTSATGTNNQPVCKNTLLTNITYATTSATGATVTGLPSGVTGAWSGGVFTISGTPTVPGTFNYTITTTGGCTPQVTATGTIIVNDSPPAATVTAPFNFCTGTPIVFTINGQAGSTVTYTGVTGSPASPVSLVSNTASVTVSGQTTDQTMTVTSIASNGCTTTMSLNKLVPVSNCTEIPACDVIAYRIEDMSATSGMANSSPANISICDFSSSFTSVSSPTVITAPFSATTNLVTNQYGPTASVTQNLGYLNSNNGYIGIPGYNEPIVTTTPLINSVNKATNILNASTLITGRTTTNVSSSPSPFAGGEYRSVVPIDSVRFYCVGTSTATANQGIFYFNGSTFTQIYQNNTIRTIGVFNGQLYASINPQSINGTPNVWLIAVGLGLPTTSSTPGVSAVAPSSTVTGRSFSISPDGTTLYITGTALAAASIGIYKYYRTAGTTFTLCTNGTSPATNPSPATNITIPTTTYKFPLALAVDYSNAPTNTLYYTLANSTSSQGAYIARITETGGTGATTNWGTLVSTTNYVIAPSNTKYMGLTLAPTITIKYITASPACLGQTLYANASAIQSNIGTLSYQWYRLKDASGAFIASDPAFYDYYNAVAMTSTDGTGYNTQSFTPLNAGYYFVRVIGNGSSGTCSKTNSTVIKVTNTNAVTANITTLSSVICSGSSTTLTAVGSGGAGAGTYTYLWSTGATTQQISVSTNNVYTVTITSSGVCSANANITITSNTTPNPPTIGTITQPSCGTATGSIVLNGLPSTGTWNLTGTPSGSVTGGSGASTTLTGLTAGQSYTFTVTQNGCTSSVSNAAVLITQPVTPTAPTIGTITQPTCTVATGSVVLNGLPSTGTWTITSSPALTIPSGTGTSATVTGLTAGTTYTFTITNSDGCTSTTSANAVINAQPITPTAPVIGAITQATCSTPTGSVALSGLPATGTWSVTGSPSGSTTGTGTTATVSGLTAGTTYTFTVTNASNCTSSASLTAILTAAPNVPTAPTIGTITQPTCATPTGSLALSGLPSGAWTVTGSPSGSASGSGTTGSVTGLTAGTTYTFTVTNTSSGCTSTATGNVVIDPLSGVPTAPVIGTITQPTCTVVTASVALSGLPSSGTWTITGTPSGSATGTGTTTSISGLSPNQTYTFTVTDATGCTSVASANAVVNDIPSGPSEPIIGTITQPTCTLATGSVQLTGLPASGTWSVTGFPNGSATGTGTSTTITGLTAGTTYNFSVTDGTGCTSNLSATATLTNQPTPPTITASAGACVGSVAPINVTATGGLAPYDVSWTGTTSGNPAGSEITVSGNSYAITGLGSGTYSVTITDANNCTAVQNSITIACASCTNPTIDTQASPISECIGENQTLTIVASGTSLTYQWYSNTLNSNSGGTLIATGTSATYTPSSASAGTVYYYCVVSSSSCTTTSNAVAVVVSGTAAISAILIQPTCIDATGQIKVTSPAAGTGITFTVTGTSPVVAPITQSTTIFAGLSPGVYSVTASNGTCSTAAVSYTINPQPSTPTISGTASTCINATTQLTGSPTAAASSPWTSSNIGVATVSNTGLVTGVDAGTTTITYTNTDGCSATVSVTISDIIDWANLQSPGSGTICVGGTFDIYGQLYNTGTVNTTINASAATGVTVEFGYSASNTNPNTWTNWSPATFNAAGGGTNNDEYLGTFTGLPAGTYYYAFRYQINGCGWQYGGYSNTGGGFWNGTSNVSGVLTVNTAPTILFISPP